MSYDISLIDPITKQTLELDSPHQLKGGTYALGGTSYAELNVTYNYSPHFYKFIDTEKGIRFIYGLTGAESIPVIKRAIAKLADDIDSDYWAPTEGSAKRALTQLLALAQLRPDGVWDGD